MPQFQVPQFDPWSLLYAGIGVSVFWNKWGRTRLRTFLLSDLIRLIKVPPRWSRALEFLSFLAIGTIVAVGVVQPVNAVQAVTAGFSWTGVFAYHAPPTR